MTLTQMEYIITLAKCLNFSEAARLLYITQPTLSKQISFIEDETGLRLFNRNNRSTTLTGAGRFFSEGLERILKEYGELLDSARQIDRQEAGRLRIGLCELYSLRGPALDAVRELRASGCSIDVVSRGLPELDKLLARGDADIVIRPASQGRFSPPEYRELFLYETEIRLVVPKDCPAADGTADLTDFNDTDFLMIGARMPDLEDEVLRIFDADGLAPRFKYVETSGELAAMISLGLGVALLPEDHFLARSPQLRFVPIAGMPPSRVCAVWKKTAATAVIDRFRELTEKAR